MSERTESGRALVTGGAGFIGAHLCRRLVQQGAAVEVWTRSATSASARLGRTAGDVDLHEIDVRNEAAVASALAERPPDRVFHLAGIRLIGNRPDALVRLFETNLMGTLHVLGGLRPDTPMVVVCSCEEYGRGPVPFRETQPPAPETAYAVSRSTTTSACLLPASPPVCVARLSLAYGPGQTGDMFIPSLMAACTAGRDFEMTTGEQTRDFLCVSDAVDALLALSTCPEAMGEVVNVGSGVESTLVNVARLVARLSETRGQLRVGAIPSRHGDASRYVCDTEKIRSLTGWQPKVDLEDGLARTLEWWRNVVSPCERGPGSG